MSAQKPQDNGLTKDDEESLLEEIKGRFNYAYEQWRPIRDEGRIDMRHVSGDPWDPEERAERDKANRPCLALDELNQYFNQVINDVRANPRAMKFEPIGLGANDKTAEFYANKAREIEYRSKGQIVYTTAFQNAVERGYGFCRVNTRYVSDQSFNLEMWLEPIVNPDSVYPDPDAIMPDSSDQTYCFVIESRLVTDFKAEFPNAKIKDFSKELQQAAPKWIKGDKLQLAEYWKIKKTEKTLLLVQLPVPPVLGLGLAPRPAPKPVEMFEDPKIPLPAGATVLKRRTVEVKSVCQYLTNGVEILKTTEWPGKYIPIVSCFGKVLYLDNGGTTERMILSMTRLARDPYMAYCFYRTCEIENVGMSTKNPYWAYEGQLSAAQMNAIAQSMHEPVAVLLAKPLTEATGQQILPLPVRNVSEPAIQALSVGAEEMRRAIQAAMGSTPLPTQAQRQNEKSGKALEKMDQSAQRGSFHFVDHYNDMIQHVGVIVEDLMDRIYDTAREVGIRKPDETSEIVAINQDLGKDSQKTFLPSIKGEHQVTVSTGPSFDSERDAASEFADLLMQTPFAPRIGDLAVKLKGGGPIMDQIAERLTPPEFAQPKNGEKPTPEQLQREAAATKQQLQQLEGIAGEMKKALDTEAVKASATLDKAQMDAKSAIVIQRMKDATAIAVKKLDLLAAGIAAENEAQMEQIALAHEAAQAEEARAHDVGLAGMTNDAKERANEQAHSHKLAEGQQGHQQALEQSEVGHVQALEQMAAAPQPQAGA